MVIGCQQDTATVLHPVPPVKRHDTHCAEGWLGLRAGVGGYEKSLSHWDSIPELSSPSRVGIPTELSRRFASKGYTKCDWQ